MLYILLSHSFFIILDLPAFLLSALEEQLAASRHEIEEACLREVLLMRDRECMMVAEI
jgi:hypothetical protein